MIARVMIRKGCCWMGLGLLCVLLQGCGNESFIKANIKGPYLRDDLSKGSSVGMVEGGTFTKDGWMPGKDGSITYDIPGLPQGSVEAVVKDLYRSNPSSTFLTLYEPGGGNYTNPYIRLNPYLVKVSMINFQEAPRQPFRFLWTLKNFPAGTDPLQRYVAGIPENGTGYEQILPSRYVPVEPAQEYTVQAAWMHGRAQLFLNGEKICEHNYRPFIFAPAALKLVVGKSPGQSFDLGGSVISEVIVRFPGV